jgi:hypothetical protein
MDSFENIVDGAGDYTPSEYSVAFLWRVNGL